MQDIKVEKVFYDKVLKYLEKYIDAKNLFIKDFNAKDYKGAFYIWREAKKNYHIEHDQEFIQEEKDFYGIYVM